MRVSIVKYRNSTKREEGIELNALPDTCPLCQKAGQMKFITGFGSHHRLGDPKGVQIILQCPRNVCQRFSIAYYVPDSSLASANFSTIQPTTGSIKLFPETVGEISPEFVSIYNQALQAEEAGLDKIAGVGYRKALEFLIKDYLIRKNPEKEDKIKNKFLGKCIADDVTEDRIKVVSKRAVWLGNDETHYTRLWTGKDVTDLKMLVDLVVYWIDSEELTEKLKADMPDGGPPLVNTKEEE